MTSVAEQPLHRALGLTDWELDRIRTLLEREPNDFELAVFSLLWSEHCGYKHSAALLRRLPTDGPAVLQGPGENAGVVDVGEGRAIAFKVESHNHPSAVEPFQGAATGVGGILRDIVAMGARPIALLDSLRFGDLRDRSQAWMFARAVGGISHYGNCVGVCNVGGEAVFDDRYAANCLVNAMCVGELPAEQVTRSGLTRVGATVVVYGATTGRDGIGGASVLASQELSDGDENKRPSVQIGDPFTGKKLIEATLELVERGLVDSLQDCGAAGLASSLSEMASKGGLGIDVRLDRVPLREEGMEPWEVMVSESQERMICTTDRLDEVGEVCRRWELAFAAIGAVTDTGSLRCYEDGQLVGDIPARFLTEECPRYTVETRARELAEPVETDARPATPDELLALIGDLEVASRAWIFGQYDQLVQSRTARRPGTDAAVLRLRPSFRGVAVSLDGTGRLASLDPRAGGAGVVFEAARNVACAGGEPLALTDCLNFGNPENPEVAWDLHEAIEGMALACEALRVPVISGNVSLYNETDGRSIYPTPVVGCVGLVDDIRLVPSVWREGDVVVVAGAPELRLDGSAYQARFESGADGRPPLPDLEAEAALVRFLHEAARSVSCLHDAAEGGLAICLAECAVAAGIGAELDLEWDTVALFGEGGGQAVAACSGREAALLELLGVPVRKIGVVGGGQLMGVPVADLKHAYESALPELLD